MAEQVEREIYHLVVRIPMRCVDVVEARQQANVFIKSTGMGPLLKLEGIDAKLQEIKPKKAPVGVQWEYSEEDIT